MPELMETPVGNVKNINIISITLRLRNLVGELKSGCQRYVVPPSRIILDATLAMNELWQRGVVS